MNCVTRVQSDSADDSWTFEVQRGHRFNLPRAADVPLDIRETLAAWLAEEAAK